MTMQSTSLAFLMLAVALVAGVVERDRIWPSSTRVASEPGDQAAARRCRRSARTPMRRGPSPQPRPPSPPCRPSRRPRPRPAGAAGAHDARPRGDFDSWMIKTYLGCWKPAATRRRRRLRRQGAARLQAGRIARRSRRSSSIRRRTRLRSLRRKASCKLCRRATLCLFRPNIAPFMSNGRPRPSTSILSSPPDDAGRRTHLGCRREPPPDDLFLCLSSVFPRSRPSSWPRWLAARRRRAPLRATFM